MYETLKEQSRAKKDYCLENSKRILNEYGIEYTEYNNGIHLKIDIGNGCIDFWPSTGKWIDNKHKKKGRGVFNLIKLIENL